MKQNIKGERTRAVGQRFAWPKVVRTCAGIMWAVLGNDNHFKEHVYICAFSTIDIA